MTDEWIRKIWYIHKMEYYFSIEKNEILPLVMTWMDPENIMLNKLSQRKKNTICHSSEISETNQMSEGKKKKRRGR